MIWLVCSFYIVNFTPASVQHPMQSSEVSDWTHISLYLERHEKENLHIWPAHLSKRGVKRSLTESLHKLIVTAASKVTVPSFSQAHIHIYISISFFKHPGLCTEPWRAWLTPHYSACSFYSFVPSITRLRRAQNLQGVVERFLYVMAFHKGTEQKDRRLNFL